MKIWSEIKMHKGIRKLHIDGNPFIVLGIQYDFRNCIKIKDFDYLFKHTAKMGCNTVFFPVQWFVAEPEEGKFDWDVLDHALRRCRENKLRLSILWFGSNQGGSYRPAPDWVKNDKTRFSGIIDADGQELHGLCPNNKNLPDSEKRAFDEMLKHLAKVDSKDHTTILMQIENEICIKMAHKQIKGRLTNFAEECQSICYCEHCNELYEKQSINEWKFGVMSLINYLNKLLADRKKVFPVPAYVNYPMNPLRPGEDVDLYLKECRMIDFVAPDYYGFSSEDLAFTMRYFSRGKNLPFIAEHSTESMGEADRNLYLAVCEHNVQGFDPWAIDCSFGWRAWRDNVSEKPFVNRKGKWTDMAIAFGRAQNAMRCGVRQIAEAQGTEDMMFYVSSGIPRKTEEKRWESHWTINSGKD